jgi:hypothetical protein
MPDIQTALSRALTEWSKDEPDQQVQQPQEKAAMQKPHFAVTNNVTRATFDFVLAHPGVSYKEALIALQAQGYKESSITALFSQMRRAGLIVRDANDKYTAVGTEYVPMKAAAKSNHKPVKHLSNKAPAKPKAWAPPALVPMPPAPPAPSLRPFPPPATVTTNDVDYLLNTLPIKQARDLYDALHKIFGSSRA